MDDEDALSLVRHAYMCGCELRARYSMSDGKYVGEINMTVNGPASMWQVLAYDLLQITSAAANGAAVPETNAELVMKGVA